jgi:phosphoglycolate phosphatase
VCADPKLVIFDCDGTIVDSQHVIIRAMNTAFEEIGFLKPSEHDIRGIIGLSLQEAVAALAPVAQQEKLEALCKAYKAAFIEQRKSPEFHEPLFAGAREILHELAAGDDILLGVATGKSRRGVDVLFEREGLADYFVTIQTADDAPSKPHPGMIDNAINETGVRKANVLMIGDTSFDIEMARNADVGAIGVSWGYHDGHQLKQAGAHCLIDRFEEINDLIAALDGSASGV